MIFERLSVKKRKEPMRLWKSFARWMTGSAMLLACAFCAFGNVGCADETVECCQCLMEAGCTDSAGTPVPSVCTCTQFTYEECGIYCERQIVGDLTAAGYLGCTASSGGLALDAC
jgi:hypothetical protein